MGIRFECHACGHSMHVKDFQAGKRSRCPECGSRFRIPSGGEAKSLVIDNELAEEKPVPQLQSAAASKSRTTPGALPASSRKEESVQKLTKPAVSDSTSLATRSSSEPLPATLRESIGAAWFVRPASGGQFGPANADLLMDWIKERRVTKDCLIWREGWKDWRTASSALPEVFVMEPVPPPPPPPVVEPLLSPSLELPMSGFPVGKEGSLGSSIVGQQRLLLRKKRQRQQQVLLISVLGILAIILIVALIAILWLDPFGTKVPVKS